jgi:hypothetical protein
MEPAPGLMLPVQSPPVTRTPITAQRQVTEVGVEASQSECDGYTGLAQQMCYAVKYGISS